MQFTYQHRAACQRLVLISSGGLGPDPTGYCGSSSAPGAEFVLPVVAPRAVLNLGNKLGSWLTSAGIQSPRAGRDAQRAALASLRLRSADSPGVPPHVAFSGRLPRQAVSALGKIHVSHGLPTLLIWASRTGSFLSPMGTRPRRESALEVLAGVGQLPACRIPEAAGRNTRRLHRDHRLEYPDRRNLPTETTGWASI